MDMKVAAKYLIFFWVVIIICAITVFITGCALDPNRESMEECRTYCCWHGQEVEICN